MEEQKIEYSKITTRFLFLHYLINQSDEIITYLVLNVQKLALKNNMFEKNHTFWK